MNETSTPPSSDQKVATLVEVIEQRVTALAAKRAACESAREFDKASYLQGQQHAYMDVLDDLARLVRL